MNFACNDDENNVFIPGNWFTLSSIIRELKSEKQELTKNDVKKKMVNGGGNVLQRKKKQLGFKVHDHLEVFKQVLYRSTKTKLYVLLVVVIQPPQLKH